MKTLLSRKQIKTALAGAILLLIFIKGYIYYNSPEAAIKRYMTKQSDIHSYGVESIVWWNSCCEPHRTVKESANQVRYTVFIQYNRNAQQRLVFDLFDSLPNSGFRSNTWARWRISEVTPLSENPHPIPAEATY